jgi:putative oxidoreductase
VKNPLAPWSPHLLSVLRIVSALLFLAHGTAKFLDFPHNPQFDHLVLLSPGGIAGIIELVGGAFLTLGLFSRIAAFIMSGEMAVAYFMAHAPQGFHPQLNHGELAIMFCFAFLYIAAAGPGPWSLDALRKKA